MSKSKPQISLNKDLTVEAIKYGDSPRDQYHLVHPEYPVHVAIEQRARLLTAAISEEPILLGHLYHDGTAWVFEDCGGVCTRFFAAEDRSSWDAQWSAEQPEFQDPNVRALLGDARRTSSLYYGYMDDDHEYRPKDLHPFGSFDTHFQNSFVNNECISQFHFGIELERGGSVSIRDLSSTNGTYICVKDGQDVFCPEKGRIVDFPDGAFGDVQASLEELQAELGGILMSNPVEGDQ